MTHSDMVIFANYGSNQHIIRVSISLTHFCMVISFKEECYIVGFTKNTSAEGRCSLQGTLQFTAT